MKAVILVVFVLTVAAVLVCWKRTGSSSISGDEGVVVSQS